VQELKLNDDSRSKGSKQGFVNRVAFIPIENNCHLAIPINQIKGTINGLTSVVEEEYPKARTKKGTSINSCFIFSSLNCLNLTWLN
jgi:hypothetical protein